MGFFGSSKKTYVESMAVNLVEDTPNYMNQSILSSITLERDIVSDLIGNMLRGLGAKLNRYFSYGKDHYVYGLPVGSMTSTKISNTATANAIKSSVGEDIKLVSSIYKSPDPYWFSEDFLLSIGWDSETDLIMGDNPTGLTGSVYFTDAAFVDESLIELTFTNENEETETYELALDFVIQLSENYYHAEYQLYDAELKLDTSVTYKWWYTPADGTYVALTPFSDYEEEYFPIISIRKNKVTLTESDETYDSCRKLAKKLDLDIDDLIEGVSSSPDVKDIQNAYLFMGVSTQTEAKAGKRYLYNFFKHMEGLSTYTKEDFDRWVEVKSLTGYLYDQSDIPEPPAYNNLTIKEDTSFNTELGFLYITSEEIAGNVDYLGEVTVETELADQYEDGLLSFERSTLVIRKQITQETYEELRVVGLKHTNHIWRSYTVTTNLKEAVNGQENDTDGMMIPLNKTIMDSMSIKDRTELGYDAIKLIFNTRVTKKLKWYQTSAFSAIVTIVAIAITIASAGSLSASIGLALGLTTAAAIIVTAVVIAAISLLVQYGMAYLVDVLGEEYGLVIAIIALIVGAYAGYQGYGNPALLSGIQSGIHNGYQEAMQTIVKDIQADMQALNDSMNTKIEELEEMMDELSSSTIIDPLVNYNTTQGLALPTESPTAYYYTRIHSGNLASISYSMIEDFATTNLSLEGTTYHNGIGTKI